MAARARRRHFWVSATTATLRTLPMMEADGRAFRPLTLAAPTGHDGRFAGQFEVHSESAHRRRYRSPQDVDDSVDIRGRGHQRRRDRDKPRRGPQQEPTATRLERHLQPNATAWVG